MSKGNTLISTLFDDLTHLEINTIIKDGMVAAAPQNTVEDVAEKLLDRYLIKLRVIISRNDLELNTGVIDRLKDCYSFQRLDQALNYYTDVLDQEEERLAEKDYIIILRMKSFCAFVKSKGDSISVAIRDATANLNGKSGALNLYTVRIGQLATAAATRKAMLVIETRDKIKLKRFLDLGTESIVMQTRFALDGDVTTRIEKDFANQPKQLVIDSHDKSIEISIGYWKSIVTIVGNLFKSGLKR